MPSLIVRNVEPALMKQLKRMAVEHGRSAEEEHREILRNALGDQRLDLPDFKSMLMAMPTGDADIFERDRSPGREIDL